MAGPAEKIVRNTIATGDDEAFKYPDARSREVYEYEMLGTVPFTAHMDSLESNPATDIRIYFAEDPYMRNRGTLTGCYEDSALTSAYVSGGVERSLLFLKGAEDQLNRLIKFNGLIVWDLDTNNYIVVDVINSPSIAGDNSYISVRLCEDDTDGVLASANLAFTINGQAQEEGAQLPEPLYHDLVDRENQTQIFSGSMALTGSQAARTGYYEGDETRQMRMLNKRILKQMEMAYLFQKGSFAEKGPNGKPRRKLQGVLAEMKRRINLSPGDPDKMDERRYHFGRDAAWAGKSWEVAGWDFMKNIIGETSQLATGVTEKDLYCGSRMWQRLADLLEGRVQIAWEPMDTEFGYKIQVLHGLQKSVRIWNHPDFSEDPALQNCGFLTERGLCRLRPYRPMKIIKGKIEDTDGNVFEDQKKAGMLYEGSMEWHGLENMAWIVTADQGA